MNFYKYDQICSLIWIEAVGVCIIQIIFLTPILIISSSFFVDAIELSLTLHHTCCAIKSHLICLMDYENSKEYSVYQKKILNRLDDQKKNLIFWQLSGTKIQKPTILVTNYTDDINCPPTEIRFICFTINVSLDILFLLTPPEIEALKTHDNDSVEPQDNYLIIGNDDVNRKFK
jgi:hypothetical protein